MQKIILLFFVIFILGNSSSAQVSSGNLSAADSLLSSVMELLSTGVDNIQLSKDPNLMSLLNKMCARKSMELEVESGYKVNLRPCISLIDDDTIDQQIPDSRGASNPSTNQGGYFSLLLPITLSLSEKYIIMIQLRKKYLI